MGVLSALVAVKGDQCDDEVVSLACELLSSNKGQLYALYVIEVDRRFPVDAEIVPATAKGEHVLRHVEQLAKEHKCRAEAELVQARQAGSAVVQEAVRKNVDAIVLGSSYTEASGSLSLGSTIPYVLKNAPCRVILWRDAPSGPSRNGNSP